MMASLPPTMSQGPPPEPPGPPYVPQVAGLGGQPTIGLDVPVSAVFLFLFVCCAVANMTIFQLNNRKGHKFVLSGLMFGFCMARITTMVMRIVWATRPENISVAIAAQVFVSAGVVILFIINTLFAQRIMRASHPNSGWHPLASILFKFIYALILISLLLLIGLTVESFFTLDPNIRRVARDIQLYGQAVFTFIAFLPVILVVGGLIVPRKTRTDKFGTGRFRHKIAILLIAALLLTLGAGFRLGANAMPSRPVMDPAWYQSKACFYIFNFTIEILVLILYLVLRVDQRFHIPNGARGAGSYSLHNSEGIKELPPRVTSEEEILDDVPAPSATAATAAAPEETKFERAIHSSKEGGAIV